MTVWAEFWKKEEGRELPVCAECGNITLYPTTGMYTLDGRCVYGPNAPGVCDRCVKEVVRNGL